VEPNRRSVTFERTRRESTNNFGNDIEAEIDFFGDQPEYNIYGHGIHEINY